MISKAPNLGRIHASRNGYTWCVYQYFRLFGVIMKLAYAIVALSALTTSVVFANEKKAPKTPNCEVKGKKLSVKDAAACEKKHGTWMEAATTSAPAEAAPAAAAAPAAPAPATEQHAK